MRDYLSEGKLSRRDWGNLIRVVKNMSCKEMADEMDTSVSNLSNFESGKNDSKRLSLYYNLMISNLQLSNLGGLVAGSRSFLRLNERLGD